MSIILGADCVPTKSNLDFFVSGQMDSVIDEKLRKVLDAGEVFILNLETPLCDRTSPIKKRGPNLITPTKAIEGLKDLGVDFVTIANNHIMDHGAEGLRSTISTLENNGIEWIGAGENLSNQKKTAVIAWKGKKVGLYACTEHEFSTATEKQDGANPFDPLVSFDDVRELSLRCDYVIVLYHGGKELYRYPSPMLQRVCQKFADCGAKLVICQHSHCIGCEEEYKGTRIVYGQGNFIFDRANDEFWNTALLIELDDDFSVRYIPIIKKGGNVALAEDIMRDSILREFSNRSSQISIPGFVENEYGRFAKKYYSYYLSILRGEKNSIVNRILNKLTNGMYTSKAYRRIYKEEEMLALENCLMCEAHFELLKRAIIDK